ncbi:hypothetical protein RN001_008458 [Aquatica leii]|uniref:Uncharacterized protein n=1 Tax=Aquatica leii TaxID=1421715 RepID=A0AAN7PZ61_9COLE|nr:hypothetical protein RN001_008458 [Aquatica leii]
MVTAGPDFATREFQKRRRTRLEQVRQQSKDIAANVRNKVRKEKDKQLSDIEKLGAKELQKWQAHRLLDLQQQYRDCLKDIGLGHAQAVIEEETEEALAQQQDTYEQVRQERGKEALQRVKKDLNKVEEERIDSNERRRYNRAVENARSSLVTNIAKSPFKVKKKKKGKRNDVAFDNFICESGSEIEAPINTLNSERLSTPMVLNKINHQNDPLDLSDKEQVNSLPTNFQRVETTRENILCPVDTRISDRIKRRRRYRSPIYDLTNEPILYRHDLGNAVQRVPDIKLIDKEAQTSFQKDFHYNIHLKDYLHTHSELPSKPKLSLRVNEVGSAEISKVNEHKVKYYDHSNRFSKEYKAPVSSVHRVNEDSIEVCASDGSEVEFVEVMYKRDKEALVRGQRALEKVKAQQDYKEIMEQLPRLQKKERLASLSANKPEFHMSGDRLKENERKRQNRIENAYEKLFPQNQIITIPPKQKPKSKGVISNLKSDTRPMGIWDIDKQISSSIAPHNIESSLLRETNERLLNDNNESTKRKESLQKMLKSLTEHRDKLANELKSIPQTSNLHRVLGDLSSIDEVIESGRSLDKESIKVDRTQDDKETKAPSRASTPKSPSGFDSAKRESLMCDRRKSPVGTSSGQCPRMYKSTEPVSYGRNYCPDNYTFRSQSPLDYTECNKTKNVNNFQSCKIPCKKQELDIIPVTGGVYNKNVPPSKITTKKGSSARTVHKKIDRSSKTTNKKVDVAIEASAPTADKSVSAVTICKNLSQDNKDCACGTSSKPLTEACEIVIKICDEGKHRISVSPGKNDSDSSTNVLKNKLKLKARSNTTWRDCFSQNSNNSTSTSYYSPPEIRIVPCKQTSTAKTILRNKPQQRNLSDSSVVFAPRKCVKLDDRTLLKHIQQLLSMSRGSVDELGVSTVSDVSSPGSSVINIESNCVGDRFERVLKQLNIDLSQFPSNTTVPTPSEKCSTPHYNTAVSIVDSRSNRCLEDDTRNKSIDEYASENYPDVLLAYNKMAESCAQKIDNLAAMIEKVRLQRMKLCQQSPISDKDNSTRYHEPPPIINCDCASPEQQKLNEQLLQVYPGENQEKVEDTSTKVSSVNSTNQELLDRFNKLKECNVKSDQSVDKQDVSVSALWLDIPRLPAYTVANTHCDASTVTRKKSKPPTSKGITVARCYNKEITTIPHELSEIPEVDSFVSGRLQRSLNNNNRLHSDELDPSKATQDDVPDLKNSSSSVSIPDILSGIDSPIQILNAEAIVPDKTLVSDSSTNDMETIETTLKRLGMGWAVTTIKKTQESLALTSTSSSSIDISKNDSTLLNQISVGTLCSSKESSMSALSIFLQGLVDTTQNADSASSGNKTSRKTSTPIQATFYREHEIRTHPNVILTAESDISSIKQSSNENGFDYMPFYSLNETTANRTKDDTNQ